MRFSVLGSGSKGNTTYVESGETALLIDAGFSGIEIQRRLESIGKDISSISAILVTHEHGDHIKGAGVLSRKYHIPVWANIETKKSAGKLLDNLYAFQEFQTGKSFKCNNLSIHPFSTNHDTADPVGFTINDGSALFGYCTDTGMVSRLIHYHLSGCNGLVLEFNHDLEMLRNGSYPASLQQRIRSKNGHLANPEAALFLKELDHVGFKHVVLAHISESNNRHKIVQQTVDELLAELQLKNGRENCLEVSLAKQDVPGLVIEL